MALILFSLPTIAGAQTLEEKTLEDKFAQLRARFAGGKQAHPAVARFRAAVDETRGVLDEAARRIETGEPLDGILPVLESRRRHLARVDSEIEGAWHAREKTAAAERFHADYRRQADALQAALQFRQPTRDAIANAGQALTAAFGDPAGRPMHSLELPSQTSLPPLRFDPIHRALPTQAADDDTPTPDDLAADSAVVLAPEIRTLAGNLGNDPARIFAWVHNHIELEFYFGAMQNSISVLWSSRASDYDTATLLIALLRAAQIPARYVNGRIALSGPELTGWVGAQDPDAALSMAQQAFPLETNATGVVLDHVWVEAYVAGGWVALDPSFKTHAFQPGIRLPYIPFARDAYLSSLKSRLASEAYLDQLRQYLQQNLPGAALSDLAYTGPIVPVPEIIPAALPYQVTAVSRRVAALVHSDMHRVQVQVSSPADDVTYLTYEMYLPEVSLQSIVLSPATGQQQLLVDDKIVATSNVSLQAEDRMNVRVIYFHPLIPTASATSPTSLFSRQTVAIAINTQQGPKFLGYLIDRLLQSNPASADPDQVERASIYLAAIRYFHRLNEARQQTADAMQLRSLFSRPEFVLTFHLPEMRKLFDRPFVVTPSYAGIDVRISSLLVDLNGLDVTAPRHVDLRRVIGMTYSALENQILEEIFLEPGSSAIKSLQLAGELRIPVLKLNGANAADEIAGLRIPAEAKTRALALLSQGRINLTMPIREVPFYRILMYGFIAEDDQGNGAYVDMIFNGGQSCNCTPPASQAPGTTGTGTKTNGTAVSDPVNVSNGNLFQQKLDLAISSRGPAVLLQRTYNSISAAVPGPFGFGWTHSYQMSLKDNQTSVTFLDDDGGGYRFALQGNSYLPPPGLNLSLSKDAQGYTVRNPHGAQWRFDSKGALQAITDRNRNAVNLSYDTSGRLMRITDSLSRVVTFAYDARNRIVSVQDFAGRKIAYTYDAAGNLAGATDAAGNTTLYTYYTDPSLAHLLQAMTDAAGNVTSYEYYGDRKAARIHDAAGRDARFFYLPLRNETVFVDARGFSASYFYNGLGNVTRVVKADGNFVDRTYTADAKLAARTDENGFTTQFTYDARGNLTSATDALGATVKLTYEPAFNQVTAFTDARGAVTRFEYDARGNLTHRVQLLGVEARFTYDNFGQLLTATDAEGNTTSVTYDTSANPVKAADPLGNTAQFQFDALRRLTRAIDPLGNASSLEYDALDRITRAVNPLNNATSVSYDANGNSSQVTDRNGRVTRYSYDALDNLSQVTDAQANITSYGYTTPDCACSTGYDLVSFRDASGRPLAHNYDFDGRLTHRTDAAGAVTGFAYNARGDLIRKTDANGNTIRFEYDADGRMVHKIFPDGTDARFTYDANGNLTGLSNPNMSLTFTYDDLNRVASTTDSRFVKTILHTYDRNGLRTKLTDSEGGVTAYTYDANSRLTQVTAPSGASAKFIYDVLDRRTGMTYSNGSSATYQFDAASRLTNLAYNGALPQFTYTYDKNSNPTSIADTAGVHSYQYDELNRLTAATHPTLTAESYRYDGAGNRLASATNSGYAYDATGRLMAAEGVSYTYDNNGNMITRSDASGTTTYIYDFENQLIGINFPDGTSAGYKYDALGRRIEKSVGGAITAYLYDGVNILIEMDSAGVKLARYTHGPGVDEPLMMERGGTIYFYHADRIGSVAAVTGSSGNTACSYTYDSFGRSQPCQSVVTPYGFSGREYDVESGLVFMRARYYDPTTGSFVGSDPLDLTGLLLTAQDGRATVTLMPAASSALAGGGDLGSPQRLNRYSYAVNNPLVFRDPSGLGKKPGQDSAGYKWVDNNGSGYWKKLGSPLPPSVTAYWVDDKYVWITTRNGNATISPDDMGIILPDKPKQTWANDVDYEVKATVADVREMSNYIYNGLVKGGVKAGMFDPPGYGRVGRSLDIKP